MSALNSTNLSDAEYDPEAKTLTIAFVSGGVYEYSGVDQVVYDGLIGDPSPGTFFARQIKSRFPSTRIA